jgi:hypothetical protein
VERVGIFMGTLIEKQERLWKTFSDEKLITQYKYLSRVKITPYFNRTESIELIRSILDGRGIWCV